MIIESTEEDKNPQYEKKAWAEVKYDSSAFTVKM